MFEFLLKEKSPITVAHNATQQANILRLPSAALKFNRSQDVTTTSSKTLLLFAYTMVLLLVIWREL